MNVKHTKNGKKGSFDLYDNEHKIGEMTYVWAGEDKFIIDHTEINPNYAGEGLGKILLEEAVKFTRESKVKILPLCPYAKKQLNKSDEYLDVLF
ncbi:GNAT family N-acetyltransferase [Fulvivirgaceae bacterium LMO-SS25]